MTLAAWFRQAVSRLFTPLLPVPTAEGRPDDGEQSSDAFREQAAAWLAAADAGRLHPPRDVHDAGAWDTYWRNYIEVGAIEQGFADMMSSDAGLPGLLTTRGAHTILCAGNGMSTEAISLAMLGFHVTALDISAVPSELFDRMLRSADHPLQRIPGFETGDRSEVRFAGSSLIDPQFCPAIHQSADHTPRGGGALCFVTGDLTDPDVSPGPFDVVIERRTVQLFPKDERIPACERLVARLADRGVFVSQEHYGGWRPGEARTHYADAWIGSQGFVMRSAASRERCESAPRLASLVFSTG